jgi:hypothetical protein
MDFIPFQVEQSLGMDIAEIVVVTWLDKHKTNKLSHADARFAVLQEAVSRPRALAWEKVEKASVKWD